MSDTLDFSRCYASSYRTARAKFRRTAADIGAELSSYTHPFAEGPDGGSLSVDVARIGDPNAPRQLVVVSGTHGLEGYVGSASQIAWMLGMGQSRSIRRRRSGSGCSPVADPCARKRRGDQETSISRSDRNDLNEKELPKIKRDRF